MPAKAERKTERVPVLMTPSDLREIDEVRFATRSNSRGETIRHLIHKGIEAIAPPHKAKRLLGLEEESA